MFLLLGMMWFYLKVRPRLLSDEKLAQIRNQIMLERGMLDTGYSSAMISRPLSCPLSYGSSRASYP